MIQRLTFAIQSAGIGLWEWDIATGTLQWSDEVFHIFRQDKARFNANFDSYKSLIHPEDRGRLLTQIQDFIAGKLPSFETKHRVLVQNQEYWIEGHGQLLHNEKNQIVGMVGTVRDITEKVLKEQELEEKIKELEKAKRQLELRENALKESERKLYQNLDLQTELLQNMASNEANLISLINNTSDSIWAVDTNYKILVINDNFKEVLKFFAGREVKVGENIIDSVDPSFGSIWKSFYDRTFKGESWSIEIPIGPNLVENNFNPIYNGEGQIIGASMFSRDITLRKQNEQKVKQNELFLTALFNNIPIGMEVFTSDGNLVNLNKKVYEIYGLPSDTPLDTPFNIHSFPMSVKYGLSDLFKNVADSGIEILDHEVYIDFNNPELGFATGIGKRWLNFTFYPVSDVDKKVSNIVVLVEDITTRKLSDQKIALSEEKFYKAFDLSPDSITMFGADDLVISETNARSKEILGYDKSEMIGVYARNLNLWVHDSERTEFFKQFKNSGEIKMQAQLRKKDGSIFTAFINGKAIRFNDTNYIMTVTRDISELKQKELEIQEAYQHERVLNEELAQREEELRTNQEELRQNIDYQNALIDQLRINEFKLKEAMKMGKMGIWEVFPEQQKLILSPEIQEIYEQNLPSEIDYKTFADFFPEESAHTGLNLLLECIKNGRDFNYITPIITGKNGKISKYLQIYGKRIVEPNKPVRVIGISQDITERKREEERMRDNEVALAQMNRQISELKLMALRSVMNPHFIFNSLNSIQYFITSNDRKNAINYLSMFSKLIRGVLNSSVNTKITLEDELDILKYYITLENVRFSDSFDVTFDIDPEIDVQNIEIPSLLIQPYVENALLHGLYNKNAKGKLRIAAKLLNDELLEFVIEDDGVGREEAQRIRSQSMPSHKSVGMTVTKERLKIINFTNEVVQEVEDLYDINKKPAGTKVRLLVKIE